jgi:hypothetical protein
LQLIFQYSGFIRVWQPGLEGRRRH